MLVFTSSVIDPKLVFKEAQLKGDVETLVDYEEVNTLTHIAEALYKKHI